EFAASALIGDAQRLQCWYQGIDGKFRQQQESISDNLVFLRLSDVRQWRERLAHRAQCLADPSAKIVKFQGRNVNPHSRPEPNNCERTARISWISNAPRSGSRAATSRSRPCLPTRTSR